MEKIRNLSLRKTIIFYLILELTAVFFLSALVQRTADEVQSGIWLKYMGEEEYRNIEKEVMREYGLFVELPRIGQGILSPIDNWVVEFCDVINTWTPLFLTVTGSIVVVFLFYRNKIRKPLELLEKSSSFIGQNQLDFSVSYENEDEMGRLCRSFECMRIQLKENNAKLWRMLEDEKILRAAIAHDIRSPLAVLKGYQEMLLEFVPEDAISQDKLVEMLEAGMGQVDRLDRFVETVRKLSRLEDREAEYKIIVFSDLKKQIAMTMEYLCKTVRWELKIGAVAAELCADGGMILEVCENVISNAVRFAGNMLEVKISAENGMLYIEFYDDGEGFSEKQAMAMKECYHGNPGDDLNHFGLGLYISRLYCEKHGGRLRLGNRNNGGAYVKAEFHLAECK